MRALEAFGRARDAFTGPRVSAVLEQGEPGVVRLTIPPPGGPVSAVAIAEDIAQGQRVSRYHVEALVDGTRRTVARGTTIGHLKIDRFHPVAAREVVAVVDEALGAPAIQSVRAHVGQR